jgi:hypothetical protein
MKMPALQFYPADWRKDPGVQSLGFFERGVWFEMLCMMHESEERGVLLLNGTPMPEEALANVLGLDNQILTTTLTKLTTYGVAKLRQDDGAIYNKRMVEDEKLCKVRREAGKKGGNPLLLNQKPTTIVNQKPTPSSSSSSSSSSSKSKEKSKALVEPEAQPKKTALARLLELGVDPQVANDWLQVRKAKRAPLTETVLADLKSEANKAGITVARAVSICAKKSWQGFNATWNWADEPQKVNGQQDPPWWSSNESMIAKGEELGLSPRAGESWGDFKGRIQTKMSNHKGE